MSKQVNTAPTVSATATTPINHLYISVETFENTEGRSIGFRIVDMYHYGTAKWFQTHNWWAMHNGHTVEVKKATEDEIQQYLEAGKTALAEKFNDAENVVELAVAAAA